jgi:hypothetical protein
MVRALHPDEIRVDVELVRALVGRAMPGHADAPVRRLASSGSTTLNLMNTVREYLLKDDSRHLIPYCVMRQVERRRETLNMLNSDDRRMLGRAGIFAVVTVAAGALACLCLVDASDRATGFVQAVTGVVALCVPLTSWLWQWRDGTAQPVTTLDAVTDALAAAVADQWRQAAIERGLRYPAPASVRWRWPELAVTGPVVEAVTGEAALRFAPLPGMRPVEAGHLRGGGLGDLFKIYAGLDSGRIVILGPPGSGKSAAAMLLLLDALMYRGNLDVESRNQVPVPVIMTLAGWDPRSEPVVDWLAGRLLATYPALAGGPYGRDTARRLIYAGRIAAFLDGLDEIPSALRPLAIRALNSQANFRVLVLSRSTELGAAVATGHLIGAAAIELQPLSAASAAEYLSRCRPHPLEPAWQCLIDRLRHNDSAVASMMATPLVLSLVRDAFPDAREIEQVLDLRQSRPAAVVEEILLGRIVEVAYRHRPGTPAPTYSLAQAQQWLAYLASRLSQEGTHDLAWWQIPCWTSASFRIVVMALLLAIPSASAGMLLFGSVFGVIGMIGMGLIVETVISITTAFVCARGGRQPYVFTRARPQRVIFSAHGVIGFAIAVIGGVVASRLPGIAGGLVGRLAFAAVVGVLLGGAFMLSECCVVGLGGRDSLGARMVLGLSIGVVLAASIGSVFGIGSGVFWGSAVMAGVWLAGEVPNGWNDRVAVIDPATCWRREQRRGMLFGLAGGICNGLSLGIAVSVRSGPTSGFLGATVVLVIMWLGYGSLGPETGAAQLAFFQLWRAGVAPFRLMHFLNDSHARGILRTVGPVYQFRHARLQDQLAGR